MPEQDNSLYVQYGCGLSAPDGWLNFDASPTLRLQRLPFGLGAAAKRFIQPRFPENVRYGDVTSGLPLQDNCCKYVYCSHILEHLAVEDLRRALKETWRILEPGGYSGWCCLIWKAALKAIDRAMKAMRPVVSCARPASAKKCAQRDLADFYGIGWAIVSISGCGMKKR